MPDVLPVSLQDILHGREPELRTRKISCQVWKSDIFKQRCESLLIIVCPAGAFFKKESILRDTSI